MQKNNTYKNIDEYLLTEENHSIRNTKLQYCGLDFFDTITQEKRLLFWYSLMPEEHNESLKSYYRLARIKSSVSIQTRHQYAINYDSLYFAKVINSQTGNQFHLLSIGKIKSIRNIIYLYLAKEKEDEYHRDWIPLIYCLQSFISEEEDLFLMFHFFINEVLPGYFRREDNFAAKNAYISSFYTFADKENLQVIKSTENKTKTFGTFNEGDFSGDDSIFWSEKIVSTNLYLNVKQNIPLYLLIRGIADGWFGSLFSRILHPGDCVRFLDILLVFKSKIILDFGYQLLEMMLPKIIGLYKKEKKNIVGELRLSPENLFIMLLPNIIKEIFLNWVTTEEFNSLLKQLIGSNGIENKSQPFATQDLELITYTEMRMKTLKMLRAEMEFQKMNVYQRLFDFMLNIRELKKENFNLKEFIEIYLKIGFKNPKLAAKIFVITDQTFCGYISPFDLVGIFSVLVYGLENKIKILFEYARIYEDGLVLDDAIEVYNMMEYAVSNDLTEFKANMLAAYSLMSEKYGEVIISNNNLFEFFTKYSLCQMLMIRVSTIDGTNTEVFIELAAEERPERTIYINSDEAQMPYHSPKLHFNSVITSPDKELGRMKSPCDKSREYSGIITGPDYSHSTKLQPKRFDPILGKPSDFDEQVNLMFGSFRITQSEMKKMVAGH